MTKVRTLFAPKVHAMTTSRQPLLILDRFGLINVVIVDNLDFFISALPIDKRKRISIVDLINANLVYNLAEKIGIKPGIFVEGDVALKQFLLTAISDNVVEEDKPLLVEELQASWQRVCSHPLARPYIRLGENTCIDNAAGMSPHFSALGAYEVFVKDYYCGLVNLLCSQGFNDMPLFMQLTEMMFSSLNGQPYQGNCFLRHKSALKLFENNITEARNLDGAIYKALAEFKKCLEKEAAPWFTDVVGWAKFELNDIEKSFPGSCGLALTNLLEIRLPLSTNSDLNKQLTGLLTHLACREDQSLSLLENARWGNSEIPSTQRRTMMKLAIEYAIFDYAENYNIQLFVHNPKLDEIPPFQWAGKGPQGEEALLTFALEKENRQKLKPFELFAIMRKTKDSVLREVIRLEIDQRMLNENIQHVVLSVRRMVISNGIVAQSLHSMVMPIEKKEFEKKRSEIETLETEMPQNKTALPPVFTPIYSRLDQSLKGTSMIQNPMPLINIYGMTSFKASGEKIDGGDTNSNNQELNIFKLDDPQPRKKTCIVM